MRRLLPFALLLIVAVPVCGQVVAVQPPNPTSADTIFLTVATFLTQMPHHSTVRVGSEIRVTFRGGSIFPTGGRELASIGALPAGVYSIVVIMEFTDQDDTLFHTVTLAPFTLVVGQGYFVPTLSPLTLAMLAMAIAAAGAIALRR